MPTYFDLYDYRSRTTTLYHERNSALLAGEDAATVLQRFHKGKDNLFATHPQSALDEVQRRVFMGLHYFSYNPAMRFTVKIDTHVEPNRQEVVMNATESMGMETVGRVYFVVEQKPVTLSIYWLDIYGGGLFLPFRDTTCPKESYGGGRYLFDTIKGSNFLTTENANQIILDFNYAYNPSCAYNDAWTCPLAPLENRLDVPIPAGEKKFK